MAAETIDQVLAEAAVAGVAGTLVQLVLTVPAPKAPRTHALVAVHQVLGGAGQGVSPPQPPSGTCSPMPAPPHRAPGVQALTLQVPPC